MSARFRDSLYRRSSIRRPHNPPIAVICCEKWVMLSHQPAQHQHPQMVFGMWMEAHRTTGALTTHHSLGAYHFFPQNLTLYWMNLTWNGCLPQERISHFQCIIFPLPKSNMSAEEQALKGEGNGFICSFPSHSPRFTLSVKSAAARSSFRGPAKLSPQEILSFGLVFCPNGQKMLDLPGKAHWLGIAFPRGGQWLWNLLSELSLFAGSLFISIACFRATEWFGVEHWSVRLTAPSSFQGALQKPRRGFTFGVKWQSSKNNCKDAVVRNARTAPKMPFPYQG